MIAFQQPNDALLPERVAFLHDVALDQTHQSEDMRKFSASRRRFLKQACQNYTKRCIFIGSNPRRLSVPSGAMSPTVFTVFGISGQNS
jgi:hypothetical protein